MHLRDYTYFNQGIDKDKPSTDPDSVIKPLPGTEQWRFYLELAPFGDLYNLLWKYRFWNQYLPEPFLWHVFDSLAEAAVKLRHCDWANMPSLRNPPGPPHDSDQMVHFDIKPDNIFLSYPDHSSNHHQQGGSTSGGSKKYDYPVIKLGDHGLNYWMDQTSPPGTNTMIGTSGFQPPEMMRYGTWWKPIPNDNWKVRFSVSNTLKPTENSLMHISNRRSGPHLGFVQENDEMSRTSKEAKFRYDEKVHVWTIGKVMYDLMTLSDVGVYWQKSTVARDEFIANGNHQLRNFDHIPFQPYSQNQRSPYSAEMTNLVRDCLRPYWAERIDVAQMKSTTAAQMSQWDNKWVAGCEDAQPDEMNPDRDVTHPKLIYRQNEINNMPRGREHFCPIRTDSHATADRIEKSFGEYYLVKNEIRHDPDWPELKPSWDSLTQRYVNINDRLMPETYHATWMRHQFDSRNNFREKYRVAANGGLERRPRDPNNPPRPGSDDDDDDDDDEDDGDPNGPYPLPHLMSREYNNRNNIRRSPPRPSVSPLSPAQQPTSSTAPQQAAPQQAASRFQTIKELKAETARRILEIQQAPLLNATAQGATLPQPTPRFSDPRLPSPQPSQRQPSQQPMSQRPTEQQPTRQQPTILPNPRGRHPHKGGSLTTRAPRPWRSPSPPAPLSPDPTDCIDDPSDSEVEIAVRTFRNGRRVSHYRPKGKNLKDFNHEYVRKRRGEKRNAKIAPWVENKQSKFEHAIRRRRESYTRRRRSHQGRIDNILRADYFANQRRSAPLPDNQVLGTTSRIAHGPGAGIPTDRLPEWQGSGTQANPINVELNTNVVANTQQDFGQPVPPQAHVPQVIQRQPALPPPFLPQPTGPQPLPRPVPQIITQPTPQLVPQPITRTILRPADPSTLPPRLPHQHPWTDEYFAIWVAVQRGNLPPIPLGVNPRDRSFAWHLGQQAYFVQDAENRIGGWVIDDTGTGQWAEVHVDKNGIPRLRGG